MREVGPGPHLGPWVPCWGSGGVGTPKSGPVCTSNNGPSPSREQRPGPSGRSVESGKRPGLAPEEQAGEACSSHSVGPTVRTPEKTRLVDLDRLGSEVSGTLAQRRDIRGVGGAPG